MRGFFFPGFFPCRGNSHSGVTLKLKGFPHLAATAVRVAPLLRRRALLPAEMQRWWRSHYKWDTHRYQMTSSVSQKVWPNALTSQATQEYKVLLHRSDTGKNSGHKGLYTERRPLPTERRKTPWQPRTDGPWGCLACLLWQRQLILVTKTAQS